MSSNIQTLVSLSAAPAVLTNKELPVTNALFSTASQRRMGLPGLSGSTLLHGFLIAALAQWPSPRETARFADVEHHTYSVRFIRLQMQPDWRDRSAATSATQTVTQFAQLRKPGSLASAASNSSVRPRIRFKLASHVPVQPVTQTLVQMDLPPIELKKEVPLPNLMVWGEQTPANRSISVPSQPETTTSIQSPPVTPILEHFLRELNAAELNIAESVQPSVPTLISLLENPARFSSLLVLPPANQVAPADTSVAGSPIGTQGSTGQGSLGVGDSATVHGGNSVDASSRDGRGSTRGSAVETELQGVTRIDLPRDGKFSFMVLGSGSSAPRQESAGALGGKVVYTVYIKVGLRKSWILQYCLPNGTDPSAANVRSASLQVPWPYHIVRPDQLSSADLDYILVHGMVTEAGKLDQLAMVFPVNLENKDLLLNSLKLWTFRPASRGGVPVAVEVLLTIPRQLE